MKHNKAIVTSPDGEGGRKVWDWPSEALVIQAGESVEEAKRAQEAIEWQPALRKSRTPSFRREITKEELRQKVKAAKGEAEAWGAKAGGARSASGENSGGIPLGRLGLISVGLIVITGSYFLFEATSGAREEAMEFWRRLTIPGYDKPLCATFDGPDSDLPLVEFGRAAADRQRRLTAEEESEIHRLTALSKERGRLEEEFCLGRRIGKER